MFLFVPASLPPALQYLLLAAGLGLAAAVTIDVLLKRSDVRAALGWIAAAWLAPFAGSLAYFLFGINRVTRRALKLTRAQQPAPSPGVPEAAPDLPEHIALLSRLSGNVTGGPLVGGNAITLLEGGDIAYPQMLKAIGQARTCIAMASYIFQDDAAGIEFVEALSAAKARGVEVRVLLDGVGAGYLFSGILRRLRAGGVPAALFLHTWLPWRMPFLNMRNHRKLLVVDGAIAFTGGMNVGAENCGRLTPRRPIRDVHFRIDGPAARLVMEAFARDWSFTTDEVLDATLWWPPLEAQGQVCLRGLSSGPDADIYKLEIILGAALSLARHRVRIVTPYFLPDARLQFAIAQAVLRGVTVEIVLPQRSDQRIVGWAMLAHVRFFRHIAAHFHRTPPPFDHSKLATVDGQWSLIGSSNWDARSLRLNFEFDLECYDADLTARLDALIDTRIARGQVLTSEMLLKRPVWEQLRDAAARLLMPYL
jgi:cardiolipin synthase